MEILYLDKRVVVCVKPAGILSTDEEGGLPSLIRAELGDARACVRTVHRLDQVVGGLMVLALNWLSKVQRSSSTHLAATA